jgi:hypothetical protein
VCTPSPPHDSQVCIPALIDCAVWHMCVFSTCDRPGLDALALRDALQTAGQGQHVSRVAWEVMTEHDDSLPLARLAALLTQCGVPPSGVVRTRAQLVEVRNPSPPPSNSTPNTHARPLS